MKKSTQIVIIILSLLSISGPTLATPSVYVELSCGDSYSTYGDSIQNVQWPFFHILLMYMNLQSPDVVTGPHIELTTDRSYIQMSRFYTSLQPPSTIIWDDPNENLDLNDGSTDFGVYLTEYISLMKPGFTANRTINTPVLSSSPTTQTIDFAVTFNDPLPANVDRVVIDIGEGGSEMVAESVISQNDVLYWENRGNGTWATIPAAISVGTEYHFEAQVQCTKRSGFEDVTIYHKPQTSVVMAQWHEPSPETGTSTTLTHPSEDTAVFRLNETVNWNRNVTDNRKGVYFEMISVPVDSNGLDVDKVELFYGKRYDVNDNVIEHGYGTGIEVECKNVISAEMITPAGRSWPLECVPYSYEYYHQYGIHLGLWIHSLTQEQLTDLGIVDGIYQVTFKDHLGGSLTTTSSYLTQQTPTQIPYIISPMLGQTDVGPRTTIKWDTVTDPNIDEERLTLMCTRTAHGYAYSPPNRTSVTKNLLPRTAYLCELRFSGTESETISEGVTFKGIGYNTKSIYFFTGAIPGDFDIDDKVNFDDLGFMAPHWLDTGCNDSSGDESDWCYGCDIDEDTYVNFIDFAKLAEYWLYVPGLL